MLVPLIPFFLVARLAVDENTWEYGPEFVFDVDMNVTSTPMSHDDIQLMNYTFVNLLCRPKGSDSLSCRLDNARTTRLDMTNNKVEIPETETKSKVAEEPFEVKFNDHGIEYLIVDEKIHTSKLNTLKTIVELLNIGADLNGKPDGTFETTENSTVGHCNVTFGINHSPFRGMPRQMRNHRYELESLPQLNKVSGESLEIDKKKNLDNCSCYAAQYYGSYGEDTIINSSPDAHLANSYCRILVTDTKFVSSMTNNGSVGSYDNKNYSAIAETITLSLKDIRAAEGELSTILAPSKTTIIANSEVERIFPTE